MTHDVFGPECVSGLGWPIVHGISPEPQGWQEVVPRETGRDD